MAPLRVVKIDRWQGAVDAVAGTLAWLITLTRNTRRTKLPFWRSTLKTAVCEHDLASSD
jgi:hypothetical protein